MTIGDVGAAYDARSREYVELFGSLDKLADVDRALVSRWRSSTTGLLVDAGCGPGQWAEVLIEGGRDVLGVDLSEQFLTIGRRTHPGVAFVMGSLSALPLPTGRVGGVLAWYSLIHTPPQQLPPLLNELRRVLRPDGTVLIGFFDGIPGQSFAHAVITAYFWSVDALRPLLFKAGLEVIEHHRREEQGRRPLAALLARRVGTGAEAGLTRDEPSADQPATVGVNRPAAGEAG